ncbi:hypothetical protein SEA_EMOTION_68 [Arthrobacter phage Emotion]|uniref:Uncharacterized protein n=1 Tax=Arthrobacter phage Emotion TaxID=3038361 RepID=A0AA49IGJ7_9CAUD|nr:hypothetical protein SEA_EMOTION_68 [Arthrobacter phage Emotion]
MSMTRRKIMDARAEALRFVVAADDAIVRIDRDALEPKPWDEPGTERLAKPGDHSWGSAATGTLRRRSMDLTRSLSDLRK